MADGYWCTRTYQAGPVGEKIRFWVPGKRPEGRGAIKKDRRLKKAAQHTADAIKSLARDLNENFREGDLLIGLDYSDRALQDLRDKIPGFYVMTEEEQLEAEWLAARHELQLFVLRLQRHAKKQGIQVRYGGAVTSDLDEATGETVRVHHHVVVNRECRELLLSCWGKGGVDYEPLSAQPDYTPIAAYLLQQVRHVEDAKTYTSSRNLRRPEPRDKISRGDTVLRAPRGALLLDAGRNVPGQVQYVRYVIPDAAAQGEEILRKGVPGLKVSDWHRRITPGMERAMEGMG